MSSCLRYNRGEAKVLCISICRGVPRWIEGRRYDLRSSCRERPVRLMEDQFVHRFAWTSAEFHAEALEPGHGEGSRLVGEQPGGWLTRNGQCELSIIVQPHHDGHQPLAETADA